MVPLQWPPIGAPRVHPDRAAPAASLAPSRMPRGGSANLSFPAHRPSAASSANALRASTGARPARPSAANHDGKKENLVASCAAVARPISGSWRRLTCTDHREARRLSRASQRTAAGHLHAQKRAQNQADGRVCGEGRGGAIAREHQQISGLPRQESHLLAFGEEVVVIARSNDEMELAQACRPVDLQLTGSAAFGHEFVLCSNGGLRFARRCMAWQC